jgi:hypothetical protein
MQVYFYINMNTSYLSLGVVRFEHHLFLSEICVRGACKEGACRAAASLTDRNLKPAHFVNRITPNILHNLPFSRHQPLKSTDAWPIGILKNKRKLGIKTRKLYFVF